MINGLHHNIIKGMVVLLAMAALCAAEASVVVSLTAKEYYVSLSGNDSNPGTLARPFRSLEKARNQVRNDLADGGGKNGITVYLRGGIYTRTQCFELNEKDSGEAGAPVIYKNYDGEKVRLLGGKVIPLKAITKVEDKSVLARIIDKRVLKDVRQIDLKALGITDYGTRKQEGFGMPVLPSSLELFFEDYNVSPARWPNDGMLKVGKVLTGGSSPRNGDYSGRGAKFHYGYDRAKYWHKPTDIWLSGFFCVGYAEDRIRIEAMDKEKKIISLSTPHLYGVKQQAKDWHGYTAMNILEEIDLKGEGYLDTDTGIYYFIPPVKAVENEVTVSIMEEPLIAMEGSSYITIQGISLECTRGLGVYMERGTQNVIEGCTLKNIGTMAVLIGKGTTGVGQKVNKGTGTPTARVVGNINCHLYTDTTWNREGGTENGVRSCVIYNCGAGGIRVGGGDKKSLVPGENFAVNNNLFKFNRRYKFGFPGVYLDGVGNLAANNYIHDAKMWGIKLDGNDHIVEYNELARLCMEGDDLGAIYMGRNPADQGVQIRYNYIHHIGNNTGHATTSIYLDDGQCGVSIHGNVMYRGDKNGAIWFCGGSDIKVYNNILIDCAKTFSPSERLKTWGKGMVGGIFKPRLETVNYLEAPYITKYPHIKDYLDGSLHQPKRNTFVKNIVYNTGLPVAYFEPSGDPVPGAEERWGIKWANNWVTDQTPGFVDENNLDFTLKENAAVFEKIPGFKAPDFKKMGLQCDNFITKMPVRAPLFSTDAPEIKKEDSISLRCIQKGMTIYYTLDGSIPTDKSNKYTSPLSFKGKCVLSAIAVAKDGRKSPVVNYFVNLMFDPNDISSLVESGKVADSAKISFGEDDTGKKVGERGEKLIYGWNEDIHKEARRRKKIEDNVKDTLIYFKPGHSWQTIVPNGLYKVTICQGDSWDKVPRVGIGCIVNGELFHEYKTVKGGNFTITTKVIEVNDNKIKLSTTGEVGINYIYYEKVSKSN